MKKKNTQWVKPLLSVIIILIVWQIISMSGLYPKFILPMPTSVITALYSGLFDGEFLTHIFISLKRQLIGFFCSLVVGLPLGMLLAGVKGIREYVLPPLKIIYPIPALAFLPLVILLMGLGETTVIFVIFLASFWPIMFNTLSGIRNLNPIYQKTSKVLGTTTLRYWFRIVFPGSLPYILTGIKLGFGISWRVIVAAEMISASSGLGFMIDEARSLLRGDQIIAGMIIIGLIGYGIEKVLIEYFERRTVGQWGNQI